MPVAPPDRDTGSRKRRKGPPTPRPKPQPVRVPPRKAADPTPEPARRGTARPNAPNRAKPVVAPKPTYTLPRSTKSPAATEGPRGKAEKFKRTPRYAQVVAEVYDSLDAQERARLRKATRGTLEGKIIQLRHIQQGYPTARLGEGAYTDAQRREVAGFKAGTTFKKALHEAKMAAAKREVVRRGGKDAITVDEPDPYILAAAGFHADFLDQLAGAPYKLLASGVVGGAATGVAAYHDPIGVPTKTLKQAGEAALALPGAAVETIRHPVKTAKESFESMEARAGEGFGERVKRIRKEGSLADIADASILIPGAGAAAKPIASVLLKTALPGAPRRLPTRAGRVISGGKVKPVKEGGLIRLVGGSTKDKVKARAQLRAVERAEAGKGRVDPLVRQAVEMNREAGEVVAVAQGRLQRKGKITREVAKARARGVFGLKRELELRTRTARKLHDRLKKPEKRAFYYGAVFGIRTPEQGIKVLGDLRTMIAEERARANWEPAGAEKRADMLPDIDAILAAPDEHFTPRLAATLDAITPDSLRAAREDPRLDLRQAELRRHDPTSEVLGVERGVLPPLPAGVAAELPGKGGVMLERPPELPDLPELPEQRFFPEAPEAHLARVQEAAADLDLATPLYFRSERFADEQGFGDRTVGGAGRMAEDATYKGSNLRRGLQDTGFDTYLRGLARNVKAKHNKRLVDDLLNEHVLAKYNADGTQNLLQIRDALTRDGVDLGAVGFWNPGIYRTQLAKLADDIPEELADAADSPANLEAFRAATSQASADLPGWKVIPIAAQRELEAQMTPSNAAGRAYDIAKGWSSRMILLTGNVPWLGAQVVQNMLGGAAGTGGRALLPTNWVGAWRNWRKLSDDEKGEIGGWLGLDATAADAHTRRMGGAGGQITKAYRTLHDWSGWHKGVARGRGPSVASLNPIQAMARADRAQNNASRIVIWHTLLKKENVKRLGAEMGHLDHLQMRAMAALGKDMGEARLRNDRDLLERMAEQTTKVVGDFATLTAFERKFLGRSMMFYPFVRFSTRLAFYTLPVEHPIIAGLTATIANMEAEDRKELYGADSLRWTGGKAYLGDGKAIDIAKLNPLGNAIFGALSEDRPSALIGIAPPFVGMLWNQASSEDYFTGKMQHYQGDPSKAYKQGVAHLPLINGTRARIAGGDVLGLSAGYRALRNMEINPAEGFRHDDELEGYQGADSLIFAPAPVEFGHTTAGAKLREKFAKRNEEVREGNDSWLAQFIPFLPENERDAARAREQIILEKAEKPKKKPRKGASGDYQFGGGGSSGYKFGGG